MPTILHKENWFDSSKGVTKTFVREGSTPMQYVNLVHGQDFTYPTVLEVNGVEIMRDQWDVINLKESDCVVFKRLAQGPVAFLIFQIATVAYSLYLASTVEAPDFKDREDPPSVFNLAGQRNSVKLGQPIPCPYGRTRMFPPYGARSYNRFIDNDQFLYQLFVLGQGTYDLTDYQFEDTATSSFQDITVAVYEPGDDVTLFPDNITTSGEVSSIELHGPNEPDYTGEIGPFVANDAGTQATVLEWDVVVPNGLYKRESNGSISSLTVNIDFSYREIDDAGSPLGSFVVVPFEWILATETPHRFTVITPVTAGRYEVKAVRTNNADTTTSSQDTAEWYQLRAELPSTKDYGDVTMIAVKSRATNNLNSKTQNRFNVIGTRKLEAWNGFSWDAASATRNPAWAFADILRSTYGGNLGNNKIALDSLLTLAAIFSAGSWNFDWVFDRKTTIYDAMKTIATACRSAAVVEGNQFTMIHDQALSLHTAAFGPENMRAGSFNLTQKTQPASDYDGIEIAYTDNTTWKEETVDCLFGSDAGVNTKKVTLAGVMDRDKAFQIGLYMRTKEVVQRKAFSFDTGREGRHPVFGDLIALAHDTIWKQSGLVESIAGDNVTVTLSEPLQSFAGDRVAFRDKDGAIDGPYACTVDVSDPYQIVSDAAITGNFLFNNFDEPPMYFFGTASDIYESCLLTEKRSSEDGNTETLSLVNYDARLYQYDNYTATPLTDAPIPDAGDPVPAITGLAVVQDVDDANTILVTWNAVTDAVYYLVQISYDNTVWSQVQATTTNSYTTTVQSGTVYVRVSAVNEGQGPWATASVVSGLNPWVDELGQNMVDENGDRILFI